MILKDFLISAICYSLGVLVGILIERIKSEPPQKQSYKSNVSPEECKKALDDLLKERGWEPKET